MLPADAVDQGDHEPQKQGRADTGENARKGKRARGNVKNAGKHRNLLLYDPGGGEAAVILIFNLCKPAPHIKPRTVCFLLYACSAYRP